MGKHLAIKHDEAIKDFVKYFIFTFPKTGPTPWRDQPSPETRPGPRASSAELGDEPGPLASPAQPGGKAGEAAAAPVTQLTAVAV